VAMQSTGVYWIPLYEILDQHGFEVYLVNARHTKNLPGRKSDAQDSQWLLKLYTYGSLNNSFQPLTEIGCFERSATTRRTRARSGDAQVNIQLANVISDESGLTGQSIVAEERD
jgi:transposase